MLVAWQTETASRIPPERQPRLIPIRMSAGSRQGVRPVAVRHATSQLSG
jgi:hypothetical protein